MRKALTALALCSLPALLAAQSPAGYSNHQQQSRRIQALASGYPSLVSVQSLTKTAGGKDIWMITIGTKPADDKPAIAVVGGVEGQHLLGAELALGFAEKVLAASQSDSIRQLLSRTTFYVFPNMSPDASEQYFASLKYERQGNAGKTDDDRDGKLNEDGFDDLDNNGKITFMRVESPIGQYKLHPDDPRVLIKADPAKGEKGQYLLYSEGIDNDKDDRFNEDGEGGVHFNKNLTHKYPPFIPGSGEFAVSEPETRALLDKLYEHFNVYAVVSFSSNNNLSTPLSYNAAAASQKLVNGWLEADVKANATVTDLYNKTVTFKDAPKSNAAGGDLLSWAYYHYARYSFSTPGWAVPKTKPDTAKKEKTFTADDPTANYLRWASQQGISNTFTDWKTVSHPDFPGQKVEVGGVAPFVLINPPYKMVPAIVQQHTNFLVQLAGYQPSLEILNIKTEKVSAGLTRVTVDITNKGLLASHTKIGERNYFTKRISVKVGTTGNQQVISGRKNQLLGSLDANSSQQLSWLIKGTGKLSIEAVCPTTGNASIYLNL
ncbi:M14 family metallopeptidase [Pseudoflavitalea rhizosphaerae]|uniref:M14 family metallopeptidase n=1 Tax=Pseudoflavitalea rhizosphaerae TaxID=1884793 RepID=UPI000F8E127E|nr:M14 family metallopeptidase [Pseudoflavitalea rhizosphaerae]